MIDSLFNSYDFIFIFLPIALGIQMMLNLGNLGVSWISLIVEIFVTLVMMVYVYREKLLKE